MRSDPNATLLLRGARRSEPLPAQVRVEGAPVQPRTFALTTGSCVVGSGKGAQIVVQDPSVSRRHVELRLVPEGVEVIDLGSSNGSYYLGQRVEHMVLGLGSRLRIGACDVVIEPDPEGLRLESTQADEYRGLTGASPAMRRLFSVLTRLEGSLAHVLIEGESGVGKELVVNAIREGSALASRPFVSVNCGAIGRELVLSELFGHKRGAFTGAVDNRRGAFDEAHEGTLFLDEIGELPLEMQPALLRALEIGEVRPIGETHAHRVKVRVLAATNRNLEEEAQHGRFRQDLYYRLAVVKVRVPPLRDRLEDVPLIAQRIAATEGVHELPEDVLASLSSRAWPGNVRELRNAIQSFLALGEADPVAIENDPLRAALNRFADPRAPYVVQKDAIVAAFTQVYIRRLLADTHGNQSEAARIAGLDRGYLSRLATKHGVK